MYSELMDSMKGFNHRNRIINRYSERDEINILVKKGDDLRKDEIICNMIFILGQLLEANGIPNHFQHYACMTTGHEEGLIEIVDHSVTLGSIYSHHSQTSKSSIQVTIINYYHELL